MASIKEKVRKALLNRLWLSLSGGTAFHHDFSLRDIDRCFAERRSNVSDMSIFQRIIKAYNQAKQVQLTAGSVYQVNNEWTPIYERHMGKVMKALQAGDADAVKGIYNNFMRESCSIGLHGLTANMEKKYFSGKINSRDAAIFFNEYLYRHHVWEVSIGKTSRLDDLDGPGIGNTYGYYVDGKFVEQGAHYHHFYATMISRLLRGPSHKVIMELGGGFGGMAYYLLRDNPDATYLDFDLPENFALTAFYLLSAFPNKKIALYGEIDLAKENLENYDAVLMPNFEMAKLAESSVDLVFNSYSLAEMAPETVDDYLAQFNRITRKFIYHVNHTRNSVVKADDFKVDLQKFELISRAPAVWNLARNPAMDEFEYIYKNKKLAFS